jgi:hypothetical protein
LDEFRVLDEKYSPDLLIMCETWLFSNETEYYNIPGYCGIFNCRDAETRGGGTAIFVKQNIQYRLLYKNIRLNMIIIEIVISNNVRQKIGTFYRSPNLTPVDEFLDVFDDFLSRYNGVLIMGDANIDILESNNITFRYKTTISTNNFRIINKLQADHASRVTDSSSTLIDHVLDNRINNRHEIELIDWAGFDHRVMKIRVTSLPRKKYCMQNKEVKIINQNVFRESVNDCIEKMTNVNMNDLQNIIEAGKETATSIVKRRIRKNNDWLTSNILKLIQRRNSLYKVFKMKPTALNRINFNKY